MSKYSWSDEQFKEAAKSSNSVAQVLRKLNLVASGANYKMVHITILRLRLDISHWTGKAHLKGKTHNWAHKIPLENILVRNSTYTSIGTLKKRLLKDCLLEYKCYICGIKDWLTKSLVLQLDHINGDSFDHRILNLRLLCPNCHSQTDNFTGRNIGNARICKEMRMGEISSSYGMGIPPSHNVRKKKCAACKNLCCIKATHCLSCSGKLKPQGKTKICWPTIDQLLEKLSINSNYSALARELGVTDNAVRKHISHYKSPW